MITPTHITFSQPFYYLSGIFWNVAITPQGALIAAICSLIPDLDTPHSIISRVFPNLSNWINQEFGHRSITHAFITQLIIWLILSVLVNFDYITTNTAIAIASGWFSHSCADMITKSGIFFFWPSRSHRQVAWANPKFRTETMGFGEWWWSVAMFIISIPLFFIAIGGQGASGVVSYAIGDISMAVQEFQTKKGLNAFYLDVEGTDNKTLNRIDGKYYIVDVKSESSFILLDNNNTIVASSNSSGDWFISRAILEQGNQERTHVIDLKKKEISSDNLLTAFDDVIGRRKAFITGKLATEDDRGNIEHHTLDYVTQSNLPTGKTFHAVNVQIQIKHMPGEQIANLKIAPDVEEVETDEILDGWLKEIKDYERTNN
ncbi:metal-dependent hydrolase [Candidatus Halobeggiatoa sp. HSG11]|nr:metal-dependent hydrolase [Candidatus Halobeggiatoa sp. HSG11]